MKSEVLNMASDFDRLNKASQNIQATNNSESEHYSRNRTVRSEEIKTGLSRFEGSWASEFSLGGGRKYDTTPIPTLKTGLGLHGFGDIDFIPYVENTNRIGLEGEATLGSPISFEVLGPTLKSNQVDWTWSITKYNDGEYLEIENLSSGTMKEMYGFTDDGELTLPYTDVIDNGGLYVVFRYIGHSISTVNSKDPQRVPYHIFKVHGINQNTIKISAETPISEVFDYSVDNTLKGVMFIRKSASRMLSVPSSGGKSYFVMPPEKSLSLDIEPPLAKWLDGSFHDSGLLGSISTYGNRSKLPVLSPLQFGGLEVLTGSLSNTPNPSEPSTFTLNVQLEDTDGFSVRYSNVPQGKTVGEHTSTFESISWVGKIIKIVEVESTEKVLGFFEVINSTQVTGKNLTLRGITKQHHTSGIVSWDVSQTLDSPGPLVKFTVHESISDLFAKSNPQPHEIDATRIKSLISPLLSEGSSSEKATMMRASDCSWDGKVISNLLDLGFKAVVYPAKELNSNLVADFENPIDPNLYELDYEGATLYFHSEYTQELSILNHNQNPTGNPVLFISCVPLAQNASFGNRFTAKEEEVVKGAFRTPKIKNILSADALTFGEALYSLSSFPDTLYIPGVSISEIPMTGALEFWKHEQVGMDSVEYVQVRYKLVETHLEGVKLHVYDVDDLGLMGVANFDKILTEGHVEFVRNSSLNFRESIYAGLSLRSEEITFNKGLISLDERGNQVLKISGLETGESSVVYDSSDKEWSVGGDYNVSLSVKRGDLVASNVLEFSNTDLTITPYSSSVKVNITDSDEIRFEATSDQNYLHEDLSGYYLNTEAVTISTKQNPTLTAGERVVFGLDFVADCHNPFATSWYLRVSTGSTDAEDVVDELKLSVPQEARYTDALMDGVVGTLTGRNACVYPAYAYIETAPVTALESVLNAEFGVEILPASRYLLSLESTEAGQEDKWVSLVVNNEQITFKISTYPSVEQMVKDIASQLNKDLYFGHSARLLDRAGFYDACFQDYDFLSGAKTPNANLQEDITSMEAAGHAVGGERQILWVTSHDVRHPRYPFDVNDADTHRLALICTGRGCNNKVLDSNTLFLSTKASLQENRLINIIASLGEIDGSFMTYLFNGEDVKTRYFNRMGYFHTGSALADNTTQIGNPTVLGQEGNLELGFPKEGLLPLGRLLGESFRIEQQLLEGNSTANFVTSFVEDPTGRSAFYPIRSNLTRSFHFGVDSHVSSAESSDFDVQNSWLDNQNFSFDNSSLTTPDFRNFAWVSKDTLGLLKTNSGAVTTEGGYVEIHASFSATPKEREYFHSTYLGNNFGGEDYIAKIDSSKFILPLIDKSVLQKGDAFYLRNSANQQAKATIFSIINQNQNHENTPLSLRVLVQSVGGQYGGYSQISSFMPTVSSITDDTFRPVYSPISYTYASLVVGNNILWNEGNIKSLLTTQAVAEFNNSNSNLRETSAIDGGYGTFGSQSATLISGGRIGLFTGLPLSQAGISFASIVGGVTWGQKLEFDHTYTDYEKNNYRVFETFVDHGVFPFVSLPSGSSSDNAGTIGNLSSDSSKKSNYKGTVFGGSSGLRVSGDIQLYVKNIRVLGTDKYTAFVVHSDNAPATATDYLIGGVASSENRSDYWKDWEPSTTGGVGYFPQSARRNSEYSLQRGAGAHMPSGVGLFGFNNTYNSATETNATIKRTATISLGLTIADLKGISASLGQNLVDQQIDEGKLNPFVGESNTRTLSETGETLFEMGQFATSDISSMALPALRGCFLYLESQNQDKTDGYFKIIDVPVVAPIDASSQESKFGSENTLHGYISNYNSKVRNSLSSIVANITVRVESNRYFSEIPNNSANNRLVKPEQLSPPQEKLRNGLDSYKWRIVHKESRQGMYFQHVYVFDVENSGGSPSSSSSDLQGVEINPRALGKRSLPAEIVPLATYNTPSDTPSDLKFNDEHLSDQYSNIRLLGVHRNMDRRGKTSSLAFVTVSSDSANELYTLDNAGQDLRTTEAVPNLVETLGSTPSRLVVYSSERSDRLDESYSLTTKRRFENGESGFVSLGYPERMGLGVVLDGGLGVVSGNAIRVHPQKGSTDSLGALVLYSFPYVDPRDEVRDGNPVSLPSRFNRTEFYGDVIVAGFNSDLVIEDARSAEGSFARINENEASASTVKNFQSQVMRYASISNQTRISHANTLSYLQSDHFKDYVDFFLDTDIENNFFKKFIGPSDYYYLESNFFRNIPAPPLPNDTLFPWTNAGIRVKSGGGLVYERAFRPQDATGSDLVVSHSKGVKSDRGIKGLEIPAFGECLLLPKGPATLGGRVLDKNDGSGAKIRIGNTPTDLPLYEFYNGPTRLNYGGTHAISIGNVLQEHGVYGRPEFKTAEEEKQLLFAPKGNQSELNPIEYDPGSLSQAYHHSISNASDVWGGKSELISPRSVELYGYLALLSTTGTNFDMSNAPSGRPYFYDTYFSLFYVWRGKVHYIELTLLNDDPNSNAFFLERRNNDNRPSYQYGNVNQTVQAPYVGDTAYGTHVADETKTVVPQFSFYLPEGVQNVFIEAKGYNTSGNQHNNDTAHGVLLHASPTLTITLPPVADSEVLVSGDTLADDSFVYGSPNNYNDITLATDIEYRFLDYSGRYLDAVAWGAPTPIGGANDELIHSIKISTNLNAPIYRDKVGLYFSYQRIHETFTEVNARANQINFDTSFSDNNDFLARTLELDDADINKEYYDEGAERLTSNMQIRLLDGMVLEDVTTGTFYTVGEVGRYRGWHSHMKPTSQVGDYVHYEHGMHSLDYQNKIDEMDSILGSPLIRNANFGSIISSNGHSSPEIITDIPSHFNYENPLYGYLNEDNYPLEHKKNGLGDIVDGGFVRRPLVGHKFRIVPNVEFVPVLGYRSVRGGISVPYDKSTSYTTYINDADAVLYDADYSFLRNDIGKKIYLCGTYEYAYVGWWVITDVVSDYEVNPTEAITASLFDVAVVRKIKRSGEFLSNTAKQNNMILPMRPHNPVLEATLDANSNGKNVLNGTSSDKNIDSHYIDPFFPETLTNSFAKSVYFGEDANSQVNNSEHISNVWLSLQYLDDSGNLKWIGISLSASDLVTVNGLVKTNGSFALQSTLDQLVMFNGVNIGKFFKDIGLSAWANYGNAPFISWDLKTSYNDGFSKYSIPGFLGYTPTSNSASICGISCRIDSSSLTQEQRNTLLGRGTFLNVDLLFNSQTFFHIGTNFSSALMSTLENIDTQASNDGNFNNFKGFYYRKGVNTNLCISHLDKNSYYPNAYVGPTASYLDSDSNLGNGFTNEKSLGGSTRTSGSATGGVRWVFSAPLLEENVGSYLHLTKQRPYRFGVPTYSQKVALEAHKNRSTGNTDTTLVNPFGWTSGYQNLNDITNGEELDLATDIFRINRCPTTGDILVGGDCESYAVEDILCRSQKGFTKKGVEISYSPLSVGGNWPDSATGILPTTGSLNYPIMYALQPIARERIVTVNPSSANSSIVLARGQHGTAPMVIPANPLALETTGAIVGNNADATASSFLIDESTYGKDYHWGEKILMDVSRPWLLFGRDNAIQTHDLYFITPAEAAGASGNPQDLPESIITQAGSESSILYQSESGNAESSSQEIYTKNSYFTQNAVYAWTPSGEWWQIQTPLYSYGESDTNSSTRKTPISPTTPPPTLRIDLTEAFTQSISAGSGLNTPFVGKSPRGSRLNRIWVNFGVDGDHSALPGSPFNVDHEEYYEDLGATDLRDSILGDTTLKTSIKTMRDTSSVFRTLDGKNTNRSITFNLVVEIPGSTGSSQEDLDIGYVSEFDALRYNQDWSKFAGEDYGFSSIGGSNGSSFGGRLPTGAYSHSNNSENKRAIYEGLAKPTNQSQYFGGTVVVPLYINREAGDMMPNVMERFVTVGPARYRETTTNLFAQLGDKYKYVSDWSIGNWHYGLGATPLSNSHLFDKNVSYLGDALFPYTSSRLEMETNAITPVVWGSQNFYSSKSTYNASPQTVNGILEVNNKSGKALSSFSLMAFDDIRSAGVLASSMPRSSRVGGGVNSSFTSGIYPDTRLFDPFGAFIESPLALHSPATTGITIAHGGASLGSSKNDSYAFAGDEVRSPQSTSSSHNSFTVALTPVGDGFTASFGAITMPSISGGANVATSSLYNDIASTNHWDFARYGRILENSKGTDPKDRRFKVGNWLDKIMQAYGIPAQSGSMLPTGARVFLEVTTPWALKNTQSNNGTWISSVKCSFEVETADGTAWTQDVNTLGED